MRKESEDQASEEMQRCDSLRRRKRRRRRRRRKRRRRRRTRTRRKKRMRMRMISGKVTESSREGMKHTIWLKDLRTKEEDEVLTSTGRSEQCRLIIHQLLVSKLNQTKC